MHPVTLMVSVIERKKIMQISVRYKYSNSKIIALVMSKTMFIELLRGSKMRLMKIRIETYIHYIHDIV